LRCFSSRFLFPGKGEPCDNFGNLLNRFLHHHVSDSLQQLLKVLQNKLRAFEAFW